MYTDFSLGFFEADLGNAAITAELKSPNADLDAPQTSGSYGGATPTEQAMAAAVAAGARWCIVSNYDEIRLYRVPDLDRAEVVRFSEILSPDRFRRAYALFSRAALLGDSPTSASPLELLHARLSKGTTMIVPSSPGHVRLVLEAQFAAASREYALSRLSRCVEDALQQISSMTFLSGAQRLPLVDDVLIQQRLAHGRVWQQVAITRGGLLVYSELLGDDVPAGADVPVSASAARVAQATADFFGLALLVFKQLGPQMLTINVSLEDLSDKVTVDAHHSLIRPSTLPNWPRCPAGTKRTSHPPVVLDQMNPRSVVAQMVASITRELFFPFESRSDQGRLGRFDPTDAEVAAMYDGNEGMAVFRDDGQGSAAR
jgi:hypothetical protein